MHENKLTLFLVSIEEKKAEKVEIEHSLNAFYRAIHCIYDCIDIVRYEIGGKAFDIICDDDGLSRNPHHVSVISPEGDAMLVGSFLVANHDSAGDTRSLTEKDIELIKRNIVTVRTSNLPEPHPILMAKYG